MREIVILTETDLRSCVALDLEAVDIVENAFKALATEAVVMPPVLSMSIADANGEVDVKTAYIPGVPQFAIKASPGFFDNPKLGLPSLNGLMVLLSATTGLVEAVMLDNGYLTAIRTAAAGAVAARHLAPDPVNTAAVFGAGEQARLQIAAAHLVRPFERVLVWSRDHDKARGCAADIAADLGIDAGAAGDPADAVRQSQLVITTTPATSPILEADWLHAGLHVTAMGSDHDGKGELEPRALDRADLYVCDRVSQCAAIGELRSARAAGLLTDRDPPELGAIVAGQHAGRPGADAVTICDLTGTGVQDTAIAAHAFARARAAGLGTVIAV